VAAGLFAEVHPYVTPLKLYWQHNGVDFPDEENAVMRRGRLMESAVATTVQDERPDWRLEKCNAYYRDPELRLGATPDYLILNDPRGLGVLQIKTVEWSVFDRYWHDGNVTPLYIEIQTLIECMLVGATFGVVGAMPMPPSINLYCCIRDVPRTPGAEGRIVRAVKQFWEDVANGREPPPDYGRDADLIKLIAPRESSGKIIDLKGDNELPALLEQREQVMEMITNYEKRKETIDSEIKYKMRDAERIIGVEDWSITWKTHIQPERIIPEQPIRRFSVRRKRTAHG
jgi:predicted phage-related endonuclease